MYNRMEEDIKTIRKRQLEIKLSDADTLRLIEKAARVGLTVSGLLENFIADLVGGIFSNGSDERMYADEWFDRCGFGMFQKKTLLRHLLENEVDIESFITAYEENEEYKAHPENFEEEMEDYGMEPGESFWFEDDLEYYLDGWKPEGKPDMNKELETIRAYLNEVNTLNAKKTMTLSWRNRDMERERIRGENEWAEMFAPAPSVQLVQVPLAQLVPWEQADGSPQPFRPYTQEKLMELADSIRQHGILEAIRVRPRNGKFQILAGHNRSQAARMAGLTTIPAIVEDVDDDQAALILVDSNLQHREKLLPSEKAWAYRTKLEAMKRQGARTDLTSCQVGTKFRSDETVAESSQDSARQIQRLIRLTFLNPLLLDLVDQEKIGMTPGVELSYLSDNTQDKLLEVMATNGIQKISGKQAKDLRNAGSPEKEEIAQILGLTGKQPKPATLKIQPDMSRYPAHVVQRLQKDSVYLAELQTALEAFTDKYLAEKGEN